MRSELFAILAFALSGFAADPRHINEKRAPVGARECECGTRPTRIYSIQQVNNGLAGRRQYFGGPTYPHDFFNNERFNQFTTYPLHPDCTQATSFSSGRRVSNLETYPLRYNGVYSAVDRVIRTKTGRFCGCVSHPLGNGNGYALCGTL